MGKYDLDKITDRRGTNSYKWERAKGAEYPLWVADMDFEAAPKIKEALLERVGHGIFGYNIVPDSWYEAYISWWDRRHGIKFEKDWLIFCTGVVPAISSTVRKLTMPGDEVVILTPVYNIFFNSIVNNGCKVCEVPLIYDGSAKTSEEAYRIDFDLLEEKLSRENTRLMIFCNPQNPVGRIWSKDELYKVGEICKRCGVTVLSDEIHCDLTDPEAEYVPFASVSETCREVSITAIAPTKAFNIAGLQTAAVAIPNLELRKKIWRALNTDEVAEPNSFAICVTEAAFNESEDWLDELREYIYENKKLVSSYIEKIDGLKLTPSKATYLLWIDTSGSGMNGAELSKKLLSEKGVYLTAGAEYGKAGRDFLRMNIACPRERLKEALERITELFER